MNVILFHTDGRRGITKIKYYSALNQIFCKIGKDCNRCACNVLCSMCHRTYERIKCCKVEQFLHRFQEKLRDTEKICLLKKKHRPYENAGKDRNRVYSKRTQHSAGFTVNKYRGF